MQGLLITLEGIDGAGKSSHIDWLEKQFIAQGREVLRTREPGGSELAEQLRSLLLHQSMDQLTELLLMFAARRDHIETVIRPALEAGKVVLCDRFTDSTYAYQGYGRGISLERIETLATWVQESLQADLVLIFDIDPEVANARIEASRTEKDRFEKEQLSFFQRVRAGFLSLAKTDSRYCVLDSQQEMDQVRQQIWDRVLGL